ncbi:N-acetylmuramoyl-L-alanine amidase [Lederbergia wuyishanensis]|uniref:N-acetylmuramoyl-L-alanine amidase n=1 Tax=Lederbergia wuyishanensis TaxID=1347903 RepID=A0ABU0D4F3_9BACI|nr:N-acetylmuramoyl-L-alanine amidase [Lederbergia wuyishanensis]MCJ8008130.1 N-acetylmuramoyl-L-alanine amidase [Lederbergia wuyishanensis]MDQ0343284.1 N-acetylmuramoyl-L-alanine amidase [Lederbergia wuyishanensis]
MVKIFIDPGHGGTDPGAVGNGLKEKDLTLAISKRIESILKNEYEDVEIKLSRTGDQTLTLKQRTDMANAWKADYLLSVHINAGGGVGFESFIYNGIYKTKPATNNKRNVLHDEIIKTTGFKDRGKKEANFHMVRESGMQSCLTESGFIDNANDAALLKQASFLEKVARGHADGLSKALNLKKKQVSRPPTKTETADNSSKLHRVQLGAYADPKNAEKLVEELKKKGYDAYITTN